MPSLTPQQTAFVAAYVRSPCAASAASSAGTEQPAVSRAMVDDRSRPGAVGRDRVHAPVRRAVVPVRRRCRDGWRAASDGRQTLVGHLAAPVRAPAANTTDVGGAVLVHGVVVDARVPVSTVDSAGKADVAGRIIFV